MALDPHSPWLTDASGYRGTADRVLLPADEAELIALLREASAAAVPVTIAGAGTGLTGGRVPPAGWVISLERFNNIEIRSGSAVCGAGVVLRDLQSAAAATGQFYPPDPTEWGASVGGSIATNASGSRSFLYGPTRRSVLALRVVLVSGEVLELRRGLKPPFPLPVQRAPESRKNTAGYYLRPDMDYMDLFIGSEGTLGVVTEAELQLLPAPGDLLSGVVFFASDEQALTSVDRWRGVAGLRMLEYLDAVSLDSLRSQFPEIPTPARACLLIEREGDDWLPDPDADGFLEASWFATGPRDRERFRRFRHALPETLNDIIRRRGLRKLGSDFAVPLGRNREMLRAYHEVLGPAFAGRYVLFGHIGDAHVHSNVLPADDAEWAQARDLLTELARRAVAMGGTVSAEHGLGKSKRHLLGVQFTPGEIEEMKQVKRRFDPAWLLGRETLFSA